MITVQDLIEHFRKAVEFELDTVGLSEWSINTSSENAKELFAQLQTDDLKDLLSDINEGFQFKIEIDLTDAVVREIEDMLEFRKNTRQDEDEEELDD